MPSSVNFEYEYQARGWARASISSGADTYTMEPSYVPEDPLFGLQAVVVLLCAGGVTGCEWWYEPALDRWALSREGESVHIIIRHFRHGFPNSTIWTDARFWLSEAGALQFTATCDLWTFAEQVHRAASQLAPKGEDDPTWVQRTVEYRELCDLLEEHQSSQPPISGTSTK